ncbi:hypothetical protein SAMN05421805_101762 [Saccharopolyspora antimicrobica]|uniref:Protein kinase domain-containing protein n=1 Tax=Saccharopolyspora antimicrobica TaxID=455193 RepID=A0A1I4RZ91_9PSEU|nr:hypothetical protein [Saccharopolyspora antimicrobica]RKT89206.1 hypothetical protein ATL45_7660 [Saccharopolyspora antimicrobica]SFM57535.1 hypothetical protein SAMN05421805_101762 [Saccharopolyspora antimicrobica]
MTSSWPLPAVIGLDELAPLQRTLSDGAGQSTGIHPIGDHPGWLAKLYRTPGGHGEATRLDELIALPATIGADDAATLSTSTSWPVARITDGDELVHGCVIPAAPDRFRQGSDGEFREIDTLARTADSFARHGLRAPSRADRLRVCRNLVRVAEVLERHGLVYSDWSYSNAFWCHDDASVFVIDIDGCGTGSVPNIAQPNWDDPLTPRPDEADSRTDRFRVALLVTRCLTGQRDLTVALNDLAESDGLGNRGLREVLLDMLLSEDRERRPSLAELGTVLAGGLYARFGSPPARNQIPERPAPPPPVTVVSATPGTNVDWKTTATTPSASNGGPQRETVFLGIFFGVVVLLLLIVIVANNA